MSRFLLAQAPRHLPPWLILGVRQKKPEMNTVAIIFVVLRVIALGAWYSANRYLYVGDYHLRSCNGRRWRAEFPSAEKDDIRAFLRCLADAMDFPEREKLKFSPDDRLLDIYRSIYGGKTPFSDDMECERFLLGISQRFKIAPENFSELLKDERITLGKLFSVIQTIQK